MRSLLALALTLCAGCNLYFGGGGDDVPPPCAYASLAPVLELRNPETGQCESDGCSGGCGEPCAASDALVDWAVCFDACEGLSEFTCIATAGCRAAYVNNPSNDGGPRFWGCWGTAPSGPIQGGGCEGLDAHTCSRHDDCSAYYDDYLSLQEAPSSQFNRCAAEKLVGGECTGDEMCAPNERCTAGIEECTGCPDASENCPGVCGGHCVPETSCANVTCEMGSHCEDQCENGMCGPVCVPDISTCAMIDCGPGYECVEVCYPDPNNTGAGVCNAECKPINSCESVTTEAACTLRPDCVPVYQGDDCTCYPTHCECNILTYDHCETS